MVMLDTEAAKDVGPYKAIVVKMQVEGTFHDIDAFLRWVETNGGSSGSTWSSSNRCGRRKAR